MLIGIAFIDFHDETLGLLGGSRWSCQIDRSKTVQVLVFNVHMATATLLEVFDGFSASADDQSHSPIRDHYLDKFLLGRRAR
jgi:hypothetical protein